MSPWLIFSSHFATPLPLRYAYAFACYAIVDAIAYVERFFFISPHAAFTLSLHATPLNAAPLLICASAIIHIYMLTLLTPPPRQCIIRCDIIFRFAAPLFTMLDAAAAAAVAASLLPLILLSFRHASAASVTAHIARALPLIDIFFLPLMF